MKVEHSFSQVAPKRAYSRIPLKKKIALIKLVFRRGVPLENAIDELSLKKTTAVNILKKYKQTGSLPMRKFKKSRKNGKAQSDDGREDAEQKSMTSQEIAVKMQQNEPQQQMGAKQQAPFREQAWVYFPYYYYGYA